MNCQGFLFDLDGTLVDSLPAVERAWKNWGQRHGIDADRILGFIHGKQAITSLRHFLPQASEAEIQREFRWLEKRETDDMAGIKAMPGAQPLLQRLNQLNIPWAIVTSGSVPVAMARHKAAKLPSPAAFVTAENVARSKPEPDGYLLGARLLSLAPGECVVVEDAAAGILAGLAAGCPVIAVNAPANMSRLADVAMQLTSLNQLQLIKLDDGRVNIQMKAI